MAQFLKLISYPMSVLHYIAFGGVLLVFHPIQWVAFNVFGRKAHRSTVIVMNVLLTWSLYFLFSRVFSPINSKLLDFLSSIISAGNPRMKVTPVSFALL